MIQHAASLAISGISFPESNNRNPISTRHDKTIVHLIAVSLCCLLALFLPGKIVAQSTASVLTNRISKTWRMQNLEETNKPAANDQVAGEFILALHADYTVEQGMYPDGLIKGTWSVDEQNRMVSVRDNETGIIYKMKIVKLTDHELVLQEQSATSNLTIYYKEK
ncbi:MAG: hypothetical protein IPO83_00400 [Chitinophagaceae bacterium]|nr:hypothetical protein [Chitinophagaceae bacterium]